MANTHHRLAKAGNSLSRGKEFGAMTLRLNSAKEGNLGAGGSKKLICE